MSGKMIGAILILVSCSFVGFSLATAYKRAEQSLQQLIKALEFMNCELQFRMSALPQLARMTAEQCEGCIRDVFACLAVELENQISPDAQRCMLVAIEKTDKLPDIARQNLQLFGSSLGRFDLQGQLNGLESVRQMCLRDLQGLVNNRDERLRSYRTLGICAGVALVILFF